MSNIAGKAYAMNLVTPVHVKTAWLNILLVPGFAILLKATTFFLDHVDGPIPWYLGLVLLIGATLMLILGLVRWIGITEKSSEYTFWFISLLGFLASLFTSLNIFTFIVFGIIGIGLITSGLILRGCGVTWLNRFIIWIAGFKVFQEKAFEGLITLSLIHYARWVILRDSDFPYLGNGQPKEKLKYGYMFFFSNFNGSWAQYVDSFSIAIPSGLNLLWNRNLGWKNAKVETPFNKYVTDNQIETQHYYNAYPLASSNDVKSAKRVKSTVINLADQVENSTAEEFKSAFDKALLHLQADLSQMEPSPIVSIANEALERREQIQKNRTSKSSHYAK